MKYKILYINNKILNKNILFFFINNILKYYNKFFIINICITNNYDILQLNYLYKNKFQITDILSFNYFIHDNIIIGDIYICKNVLYFKAIYYCINIQSILLILIVHGILHLLNYHHYDNNNFKLMRITQNKFLFLFKKKYYENYFK